MSGRRAATQRSCLVGSSCELVGRATFDRRGSIEDYVASKGRARPLAAKEESYRVYIALHDAERYERALARGQRGRSTIRRGRHR